VLAASLCLSAFFSGSETALFSFQPHELARMKDGPRSERPIAALRARPRRLLITILFGNMVANVVFYSVSYTLVVDLSRDVGSSAAVLSGLASLLLVLVFGEVAPKNFAVSFHRPIGRAVAYPLLLVQKLLLPVVLPLEKVADGVAALSGGEAPAVRSEELKLLADLSAKESVVDAAASRMIAEVIGLSEVRVTELMVPRMDMVSFDLREPESKLLELFRSAKLSLIPVYEGEVDRMMGLIHVKDVLFDRRGRSLAELVRPVPFLPETTTVEQALRESRRTGSKTAFVVDEHGAVVGLVTVEDLLEEIVGEISDEYDPDRPPPVEPIGKGLFRVHGSLRLRRWREMTGIEVPELGVETMAGLVMALLDRVPRAGDSVRHGRLEFKVETVRRRRVERLLVRLLPEDEAHGAGVPDD